MNSTAFDAPGETPLNVPLVTAAGNDGRVRIWTSQWCGLLCGPPPRLILGLPNSFAAFIGKTGIDSFGVSLPADDLRVSSSLPALLAGAGRELLEPAGLQQLAGAATGVPLLGPCPVQFECRDAKFRFRAGQVLLSAEVAAFHFAGRAGAPDSPGKPLRIRPRDLLQALYSGCLRSHPALAPHQASA